MEFGIVDVPKPLNFRAPSGYFGLVEPIRPGDFDLVGAQVQMVHVMVGSLHALVRNTGTETSDVRNTQMG